MARAEQSKALSTEVQPPRLPYPPQAAEVGIPEGRWKALTDAVFPSAKTVDGVMLALEYARARNLDVFKRVIHVVPMWNSALGREVETVWPGIGELRSTAFRTGKMAGVDECVFGPDKKTKFEDSRERTGRNDEKYVDRESAEIVHPEWAQVTVYRMVEGQRCAFVGPKVRFVETFSGTKGLRVPNSRWQLAPYQMLEKCAEAAALRRAFPEELGDEATAEEMEGRAVGAGVTLDGEFSVVHDAAEPRPTRETGGTRSKDGDGEAKPRFNQAVDAELKQIQERLDKTHNPDVLPGALDQLLRQYSAWPKKALEEVRRMFADRITFLKGDEPEPAADEAAAEEEGGQEDTGYGDEDFARYATGYVRELGEKLGNAPDLNSLQSRETTALDQLPPVWRAYCDQAFAIAMRLTKEGGDVEEFQQQLLEHHPAGQRTEETGDAPAGEEEDQAREESK